jgi:hypothetical protein
MSIPRPLEAASGPHRFSRCCGATLVRASARSYPPALQVYECGLCGRVVLRLNPRTKRYEWLARGVRPDDERNAP